MASSSTPKWTYDVFLSFRGEDTRNNFVHRLYTALNDRAIYTFKDDQKLQKGKSISPELVKAIEQSKFAIVVFSRNYADSSWCLNELVKIVDCKNSIDQTILPVFYYVNPSEVRKQKGCFKDAFLKHEINGTEDDIQIQRWRNALAEAASVSGWTISDITNERESKCIKEIVGNIFSNLECSRASSLAQNLIGIESRVQNVKSLLLTGSDEVEILGVLGMGGVGKTTLARAVFLNISDQFEGRSFVENVREVSKSSSSGLKSLQEKVLSEILMEKELKLESVHDGIIMMSRLCHKKVLLVLDDVDHVNQLEALAGMRNWFGKGSRIIITTRDEHMLVVHGVDKIYKAVLLNDDEALLLFNKHAFRGNSYPKEYEQLSRLVVRDVSGLPLALKVLGSLLCGRNKNEWESALNRLKHVRENEIVDVLKISFDGLKYIEQQIFLDIACFFVGMEKDEVSEILDSFDFDPVIGISILIQKSLLNVSNGTLQMHDLIKEMAWDIVYQMDQNNVGGRSRLWLPEDVHAVFINNAGTEAIEGIKLNYSEDIFCVSSFQALKDMKKLRLLDISYNGNNLIEGTGSGPEYLSNELRWLHWVGYPSKSLPESFRPDKLVYINMPLSNIVELWKGRKILGKLKFFDLSTSGITSTPDFTGAPNLEKLILRHCISLKEIHPSVGNLQRLTDLDLYGCASLKSFSFGFNMTSLETLTLSCCNKLKMFPQIQGSVERLTKLYLDDTLVEEVHPSIGKLTGLMILDLSNCKKLRCLPSTISHLKCLEKLNLSFCSKLKKLPDSLGQMESLEELLFIGCAIRKVPSSIVQLKNLKTLSFMGSKDVSLSSQVFQSLSLRPKASIYMDFLLQHNLSVFLYLKKLELVSCGLSEVPSNLSQMPALEELCLDGNYFTCISSSLCQFPRLKVLELRNCKKLKVLGVLPQSIAMLKMDNCENLESIEGLLTTKLEWLHEVSSYNCFKLTQNEHHHSSSSSSLADMLFQSMLQGQAVAHHQISIVVPGTEIPDWISCQLEVEDPRDASIYEFELKLLPDWDRRIAGFAIFCILCVQFPSLIFISLGDELDAKQLHINWLPDWLDSDHVWVGYISLELFGQQVFGDEYKNQDDWIRRTKESFLKIKISDPYTSVKKFGIHVVYMEDVKQMTKEEEDDHNNSSAESSLNFGFFPTNEHVGHFYF